MTTRPTRRDLLRGASAAMASGMLLRPGLARAATKPTRMLVVLVDGGWDVTFTLDPKVGNDLLDGPEVDLDPNNPDDIEEVRQFADIPILCNDHKRPAVTTFFENWAETTAVINGIWSESVVHQDSRARMLTGTKFVTRPDLATIIGFTHGTDKPLGTVDFSGRGFMGKIAPSGGRVGTTSQLRTLVDPDSAFPAPADADYVLPTYAPSEDESDLVASHLRSRLDALKTPPGALNEQAVADLHESYDRRDKLVQEAGSSLADLTPGYWPEFELQTTLAVDLLAKGVCQTATLGLDGWDSHSTNSVQHDLYNQLFATLDMIGMELVEHGIYEDTLVVVVSEMGRTPRINGSQGKDHWPHTSMLLFGGGLQGGRAYGGTNELLESETVDLGTGDVTSAGKLLKYDNLCAGLLEACDVDPAEWLPGVEAFRGAFV